MKIPGDLSIRVRRQERWKGKPAKILVLFGGTVYMPVSSRLE